MGVWDRIFGFASDVTGMLSAGLQGAASSGLGLATGVMSGISNFIGMGQGLNEIEDGEESGIWNLVQGIFGTLGSFMDSISGFEGLLGQKDVAGGFQAFGGGMGILGGITSLIRGLTGSEDDRGEQISNLAKGGLSILGGAANLLQGGGWLGEEDDPALNMMRIISTGGGGLFRLCETMQDLADIEPEHRMGFLRS